MMRIESPGDAHLRGEEIVYARTYCGRKVNYAGRLNKHADSARYILYLHFTTRFMRIRTGQTCNYVQKVILYKFIELSTGIEIDLMGYEIDVQFKGHYVLARLTGQTSYDISLRLWNEIAEACEQNDCYNILGISDTTNELKTLEAHDHVKIFREAGITRKHRIAWVSLNPEPRKMIEFVETVLKNRGMLNGQVFSDVSEAKKWLLEA